VDLEKFFLKTTYNTNDGVNGEVSVLHAPNHQGAKGTDFILKAIQELQEEGLKIKLILLERTQNDEVIRIMREETDIAVNEVIGTFYALFCIEAMAVGLPVITNLSVEEYTRVFRRFSYLNECPLVSGTAEDVKEVLRVLVRNPRLREELGRAGRKFTEKYHSEKTAQYVFEKIYDKIWYTGRNADLMNMFHPIRLSSYNNQSPLIQHPLTENKLPESYFGPKESEK
jgi:hypothetical protein